jgi:hypothetical protein
MDGAIVQSRIWRGYGKAAEKIGFRYQFYRPIGDNLQLEDGEDLSLESGGNLLLEGGTVYPGTYLFTQHVSLNAEDMKYGKPNKYGKSTWYALFDGKELQVGDYLIGLIKGGNLELEGGGDILLENCRKLLLEGKGIAFFIAAMQPLLPILVVECNRVVSIYSPQAQDGVGAQDYAGTTTQNQKLLVSNVPCSILQGTKGEKSETDLPGDTRSPWWTILMPASVGRITQDTIIIDDLDQRYIVSSNENSEYGWRLTAMMADA